MADFTLTVLSKHVIVRYGLGPIRVKAELSDWYSQRSLPVIGFRAECAFDSLLGTNESFCDSRCRIECESGALILKV